LAAYSASGGDSLKICACTGSAAASSTGAIHRAIVVSAVGAAC